MLRTALAALVLPILNLAAAHRPWHLPRQAETGTAAAAGTIATGTIPTSSAALPTGSHHENVIADVIILGGGIAGISAALTLVNMYNLSNILLLEARPELGGRAHTEYLTNEEGEQVTVEKGCNWIQGPGKEVVQDLVDKWGLKTTPTDYTDVVYFRGEWSEDEDWQTAQAQEKRGKFLSDEEVKNFTGPYDAFLEAAPEYSGMSLCSHCHPHYGVLDLHRYCVRLQVYRPCCTVFKDRNNVSRAGGRAELVR